MFVKASASESQKVVRMANQRNPARPVGLLTSLPPNLAGEMLDEPETVCQMRGASIREAVAGFFVERAPGLENEDG
jgi:hypothetical protein